MIAPSLNRAREPHYSAGMKTPFVGQSILGDRGIYMWPLEDHRPGVWPGKGPQTMFTSIVRLYQAWRRHEAVRNELLHLTDRELADIGITRSDIERIASGEAL